MLTGAGRRKQQNNRNSELSTATANRSSKFAIHWKTPPTPRQLLCNSIDLQKTFDRVRYRGLWRVLKGLKYEKGILMPFRLNTTLPFLSAELLNRVIDDFLLTKVDVIHGCVHPCSTVSGERHAYFSVKLILIISSGGQVLAFDINLI